MFVVVNDSLVHFNLGEGTLLGDALFVFIAAVWAVYGALSRPLVLRLGAWRTTGWSAILGAGILAAVASPAAVQQDWNVLSPPLLLAFAHLAVVIGCFGLAAWSGGLARLGLTRVSVYLYLSPVVGITLSGIMLGDWLSAVQLAGAGCSSGGALPLPSCWAIAEPRHEALLVDHRAPLLTSARLRKYETRPLIESPRRIQTLEGPQIHLRIALRRAECHRLVNQPPTTPGAPHGV